MSEKIKWVTAIIIGALLVGFYFVLPNIIRIERLSEINREYRPLSLVAYFDESHVTQSRLNRFVLDGKVRGDTDLWENTEKPSLWPPLVPWMMSPIAFAMKDATKIWIASDLIFPMIHFLLITGGTFLITRKKWFSMGAGLVFCFAVYIALLFPPLDLRSLKEIIKTFLPFHIGEPVVDLGAARRESFVPSLSLFYLSIIASIMTVETTKRYWIWIAGISSGLLFYSYFFHWVGTTLFLGSLLGLLLLKKNWETAKRIGYVIGCMIVVSIPFFVTYSMLQELSYFKEVSQRVVGMEYGHGLRWEVWRSYVVDGLLGSILYWLHRKKKLQLHTVIWMSALLVANVVSYNVQVVTGFVPGPEHWAGRVIFLFRFVVWTVILTSGFELIKERSLRLAKIIQGVAITLVASLIIHSFVEVYYVNTTKNPEYYSIESNLLDSYEWINKELPDNSVVVTPSYLTGGYLRLYTDTWRYVPSALVTVASQEEIVERFLIGAKLAGISEQDFANWLSEETQKKYCALFPDHAIETHQYCVYFYLFGMSALPTEQGTYFKKIVYTVPASAKNILTKYTELKLSTDILEKYRMDYVYLGPFEKLLGANASSQFLGDVVYDKDGILIYKINTKGKK